ncbi:hypothetical protein [Streptomyces sp. NPDC050145]|uniref:hypothetical protein n=1 Tax=Streptomyces sp. NPDC050145 TaxID=3365602 RepID=UPI0037B3816D
MVQPLLFIDVDGPLNPYAAQPERRPAGYRTHRMRPTGWEQPWVKPLRVWLDPAHGPALLALPYELVWCTTWQDEANEWIGPHLGLPRLPYVAWPEDALRLGGEGRFWKTEHVVRWAAGRPFAWVDDEVTDADRRYVAARHPAPALLYHVSPRIGLVDADFACLDDWATGIPAGPGHPAP